MLSISKYSYQRYEKKMKSRNRLTKYKNVYKSQIIQYGRIIHIKSKQNIVMWEKDDNALEYLGPYKDKKYTRNKQYIKKDYKDLIRKSSDTKSRAKDSLSEYTSKISFANESSLFLKEIRFDKQKFFANKLVLGIKYYYPGS